MVKTKKRDAIEMVVLILAITLMMFIDEMAYAQDCKEPGSACIAVEGFTDKCCGDNSCKSGSCQPCPTPSNGMACSKLWTDPCCEDYTCDAWFSGGKCHDYPGPGEECSVFSPCRKGYTCSAWFWGGTCNAS